MFPYVTRMGEAFSFWNIMVESETVHQRVYHKTQNTIPIPKIFVRNGNNIAINIFELQFITVPKD